MSGDELRHPDHLLKGLRHTRRYEDRPVPLAVMDDVLAAGRSIEGVRLQVIDDLVSIQELAEIGTFAQSVAGVPAMIVVLRDGLDHANDLRIGSRVSDAVLLAAGRHGLGGGYSWFGTATAQEEARSIMGVSAPVRVVVTIGIGYVDDDPDPQGSSLKRVQVTLDGLSGNRDRPSPPDS